MAGTSRGRYRASQAPLKELIAQLRALPEWMPDVETWFRVAGPSLSVPTFVRLGTSDKGAIVCTGLFLASNSAAGVQEITTRAARVPVSAIVSAIVRGEAFPGDRALARTVVEAIAGPLSPRAVRVRLGAKGYADSHYVDVVARYRRALKNHPAAPTKALIAQYPNYSEATVRYWLRVARKRGFLGRAELGRAGERKPRRGGHSR